jgi:hypothetical protein
MSDRVYNHPDKERIYASMIKTSTHLCEVTGEGNVLITLFGFIIYWLDGWNVGFLPSSILPGALSGVYSSSSRLPPSSLLR